MENDNTNIVSRNEVFLKKIRDIILDNLENETFDVVELSQASGYSRSQLYRKIKSISGKTIIDFINCLRLEEALNLLVNDAGSISEIAYKVGFNSPNYFSRIFHEKYGCAPTQIKCLVEKEGKTAILEKFEVSSNGDIKKKKHHYVLWTIGFAIVLLSVVAYVSLSNNQIPKPVLKHSYTFEDGTAKDVVGDAHGIIKGDGEIINGFFITDEQEEYLELPGDKIKINNYPEITLEAYLMASKKNTGTPQSVISYFGNIQDKIGVDFIFQSISHWETSLMAMSCKNYSTPWETDIKISSYPLKDDKYHHIVTTFNNYNLKLYIDGNLVGQAFKHNEDNTIVNLSNELAFLCKSGFTDHNTWLGAIDAFNIYKGILDAETIASSAKTYLENSDYSRVPEQLKKKSQF
ncbi:helix-turn-helix domain-containing protein [Tamlana flava]|uniref:helix-turn-helix domain-containing protein n=1 Tax=Tamlana flava TaxID=3158572 RepID=UPI00351ADDAE